MTLSRTIRRGVLAAAVVVLAPAAVAGFSVPAMAQQPLTIRISTPAVPGDWHTESLYIFKEWLERSAPGQFDVQVFPNATLFKQGTEPAAMQRGNLDMALISMQDISKQIPEYSIFTAGYLIRDPDHQQKVFSGEIGQEVFGQVEEQMGIKVLNTSYLGTRQLNLRDVRDVSTPSDLDGVKLRMPGSDTWQFLGKALGANPTPLAFPEVYLALQTGTIDGQDNPLPTDKSAKFYEVTEQIVLTSHLVDAVFLAMAVSTWQKLDPAQQELVAAAAQHAAAFNNENRIRDEANLLSFFKEQGLTVTTPDVDAFREHVQQEYLASEFSATWPEGLIERINAVQ
ncbi:MAG: sialic acid TRAP transporter substrate-binding protein SiaP [Alphaproteobacteria bacterium]